MTNSSKSILIAISLTCASAGADCIRTLRNPPMLIVENGQLQDATNETVVSAGLKRLETEFRIFIRQNAVAGYILNLDQSTTEKPGFNLDARLCDPRLSRWFHDPLPQMDGSAKYTDDLWAYAKKKAVEDQDPAHSINMAVAYTHIDHIYFPLSKFKRGYYINRKTKQFFDEGFESILHEALHVWHLRNYEKVNSLLRTKGSHYDKVNATKAIHQDYLKELNDFDSSPINGFANHRDFTVDTLRRVRWPQRYGVLTQRGKLLVKDQYSNDRPTFQKIDGQETYLSDEKSVGDLHSLDNEMEYFAILMQLAVFSPDDFKSVATMEEAEFANRLYSEVFGQQ